MNTPRDLYTHGHQEAVLRSHRWRTSANSAAYLLPHLRAGQRLLDVGCGPGTLTVDLALKVTPGETVGVDVAGSVIAEATAHASERAVTNVSFYVGDFRESDLEPASFDVVHAHQVLQHLREPVDALVAMAALTRPGGIVAARDSDYSAFTWSPANPLLDRWRETYTAVARHNGADPAAGRHLLRWAHSAHLEDIWYGSSTWTFATVAERQWWSTLWAERCVSSSFARQAVDYGIAAESDLRSLADGWRAWADNSDAVFICVHGELLGHPR